MRQRLAGFMTLGVLGCLPLCGLAAAPTNVGQKVAPVTFRDGTGKPLPLADLRDKKAIVVVFLSFECPVSTSYSQPLSILAAKHASQGVAFVGVCTNAELDAAELTKRVKEYSLGFPVYRDPDGVLADAFQAATTPEAFILDGTHTLRYRGRIDNAYAARLKKNRDITQHDLHKALDEVVAAKEVTHPVTVAVGCPIGRTAAAKETKAVAKATFHRDVLPILQKNCQACHRPGAVGPFSLMNFRQAVNWASDIKEYTHNRKMPPWKPSEGPALQHERRLSDRELAVLADWADHGTPEGDPKDGPTPVVFADGWSLGTPDLVLTVPEDFQLGPTGKDLFRVFVLPTGLTEDKHVVAYEVRPGNPRIVHHTLNFLDTTGQGRKLLEKEKERKRDAGELDQGPGYTVAMGVGFLPTGAIGGWAPGQVPHYLPEGVAYLLPKGSDVAMQVHYHRDGRLERDRTQIGFYFAKGPIKKRMQGLTIRGQFLYIPRNESDHHVKGSLWVDQDCTVHSVMPHMHLLGKQIKITMHPPEGPPQTLVGIKDWDYNWQETYWFREPLAVKKGSRFDVEAVYDNSDKNPNNPFSPPRPVFFGEQTTNEMCFGFLGATSNQPGRIPSRRSEK